MLVDLNQKDFKLIRISLERLLNKGNDDEYIIGVIKYIDDCIHQFDEEISEDHHSNYRLTNKERNSWNTHLKKVD